MPQAAISTRNGGKDSDYRERYADGDVFSFSWKERCTASDEAVDHLSRRHIAERMDNDMKINLHSSDSALNVNYSKLFDNSSSAAQTSYRTGSPQPGSQSQSMQKVNGYRLKHGISQFNSRVQVVPHGKAHRYS